MVFKLTVNDPHLLTSITHQNAWESVSAANVRAVSQGGQRRARTWLEGEGATVLGLQLKV